MHRWLRLIGIAVVTALATAGWQGAALAFEEWSTGGTGSNCTECHGDFRSSAYVSNTDGMNWGNLHNLHRQDMLDGDCDTCHGNDTFPVLLAVSLGGDGLSPISCMGCHGRSEDDTAANPEVSTGGRSGFGAGLRQQHFRAGVTSCDECHLDADPAAYTVVGENVLPDYYANPGNGHPNLPTNSCNDDGSENFAGAPEGLDNDGDDLYDGSDSDCVAASAPGIAPVAGLTVYPNPAGSQTTICFSLTEPGLVRLQIYDSSGKRVRTLVNRHHDSIGVLEAHWDGADDRGHRVGSGMYYYSLRAGTALSTGRIALIE